MSENRLQKLEARVQCLRTEAEAFKRQSYQQADVLRDLLPALSRLGHAANDATLDAALRLSRGVNANSQDIDEIQRLAGEFLSINKQAMAAGDLQPHETRWRMQLANALERVVNHTDDVGHMVMRLREGEALDEALEPLVQALAHTRVHAGTCQRLADMVAALPLEKSAKAMGDALCARLDVESLDLGQFQRLLDQFAVLLEQALQQAVERDQQMRRLVWHLSSELGTVERALAKFNERDEATLANALSAQDDIHADTTEIVSIFDQSDSLAEVRDHVLGRARSIRARMDHYANAVQREREQASHETTALIEQLSDLEAQLTSTQRELEESHRTAAHDHLTGLYNRRAFEETTKSWLDAATRTGELHAIVWDIDHFKQVNDSHGHAVGDTVLEAVAAILRERTGDGDLAARLGGEEFVSVIRGAESHAILAWADSVREQIALCEFETESNAFSVSVSCGITAYQRGDSLPSLLVRADKALYDAKRQGRNRCLMAA